ncbi:Tyrosine-protein kinase ephrin type A/B receptor-like domain-containing protein [Entamoeba marina]
MFFFLFISFFALVFSTQYTMVASDSTFLTSTNWNPQTSSFTADDDLILPISGTFSVSTLTVKSITLQANVVLETSTVGDRLTIESIYGDSNYVLSHSGTVLISQENTAHISVNMLMGTFNNTGIIHSQQGYLLTLTNYNLATFTSSDGSDYFLYDFSITNYGYFNSSIQFLGVNSFISYGGQIDITYPTISFQVSLYNTEILSDMVIDYPYSIIDSCSGNGLTVSGYSLTITNSTFKTVTISNINIDGWSLTADTIYLQNSRSTAFTITDSTITSSDLTITNLWEVVNSELGDNVFVSCDQITLDENSIFFGNLSIEDTYIPLIRYNGSKISVINSVVDTFYCYSEVSFQSTIIGTMNCYSGCIFDSLSATTLNVMEDGCSINSLTTDYFNVFPSNWTIPGDAFINTEISALNTLFCESSCYFSSGAAVVSDLTFEGGELVLQFNNCEDLYITSSSITNIQQLESTINLYLTVIDATLETSQTIYQLTSTNSIISILSSNPVGLATIKNSQFTSQLTASQGTPIIIGSTFYRLIYSDGTLDITNSTIKGTITLTNSTVQGDFITEYFNFDTVTLLNCSMSLSSCLTQYSSTSLTSIQSTLTIPCVTQLTKLVNIINTDLILTGNTYISYGVSLTSLSVTNKGTFSNQGVVICDEFISTNPSSSISENGTIHSNSITISTSVPNSITTNYLTVTESSITMTNVTFNESTSVFQINSQLTITHLQIVNGLFFNNDISNELNVVTLIASGMINGINDLDIYTNTATLTSSIFYSSITSQNILVEDSQLNELKVQNGFASIKNSNISTLVLDSSECNVDEIMTVGIIESTSSTLTQTNTNSLFQATQSMNFDGVVQVSSVIHENLEGTITFNKPVLFINVTSISEFDVTINDTFNCEGNIESEYLTNTIRNNGEMNVGELCYLNVKLINTGTIIIDSTTTNSCDIENFGVLKIKDSIMTGSSIYNTGDITVNNLSNLNYLQLNSKSLMNLNGDLETLNFICKGTVSVNDNTTLTFSQSNIKYCTLKYPAPIYHLHLTNPSTSTPYYVSITPTELPEINTTYYLVSCPSQPFFESPDSEVTGVDTDAIERLIDDSSYNISITYCPSGSSYIQNCITCDPGYHQIKSSCYPCETGTYSVGITCISCEAGTYSDEGSSSCYTCEDGYISQEQAKECEPCLAGYYEVNHTICKECPDNSVSTNAANICTECPSGLIKSGVNCVDNSTNITYACDPGYFYDQYDCIECVNGYADEEGCIYCDEGFEPNEEKNECVAYNKNQWIVQILIIIVILLFGMIIATVLIIHVILYKRDEKRKEIQQNILKQMLQQNKFTADANIEPLKSYVEDGFELKCQQYLKETDDEQLEMEVNLSMNRKIKELMSHVEQYEEKEKLKNQIKMGKLDSEISLSKVGFGGLRVNNELYDDNNIQIELDDLSLKNKNQNVSNPFEVQSCYDFILPEKNELALLDKKHLHDNDKCLSVVDVVDYKNDITVVRSNDTEILKQSEVPGQKHETKIDGANPIEPKRKINVVYIPPKTNEKTNLKNPALSKEVQANNVLNDMENKMKLLDSNIRQIEATKRSLSYQSEKAEEVIQRLEKLEEELEQKKLNSNKEEIKKKIGIDGGSSVQDIIRTGALPGYIPIPDRQTSGYLK